MNFKLMMVDDDKAVRRILAGIIEKYNLGEIVGEAQEGEEAERKIAVSRPDIALMDLLLPGKDGIEVIRSLRQRDIKTNFIMISQVEDQTMISQAYRSGIEFFIHKPINVVETVNVISRVEELIRLKTTVEQIKNTVTNISENDTKETKTKSNLNKIEFFLADLGILGEAGSDDIKIIIQNYDKLRSRMSNMQDIYQFLKEYFGTADRHKSSDVKAIEMRIRRAVDKALRNIASLGIEDYNNEQFVRFSSALFDFSEVRKEMDLLRGKNNAGGKINVRKFLEGSAFFCKE